MRKLLIPLLFVALFTSCKKEAATDENVAAKHKIEVFPDNAPPQVYYIVSGLDTTSKPGCVSFYAAVQGNHKKRDFYTICDRYVIIY